MFGDAQVAAFGAPAHANAAMPAKPAPGTNCRVNVAVCPDVMVAELEPGPAGEIVKAGLIEALRLIICGELGASSVMVITAAAVPVVPGETDTAMVQVAPTA